jgi:hypothetical protein
MTSNITIVTAASSNHYKSLLQFLRSVPNGPRVVVYDLGLTEQEVHGLPVNVLYRKFNFSIYPEFIQLSSPDAGAYAWKPCIVNDVCREFGGIVLWCDSGNIITDLKLIVQSILKCSVYSSITSGTFETWTHPTARQHLPQCHRFLKYPMRNASCIGIDYSSPYAQWLLYDWKYYALRREISIPYGANRSNHRHDQSILTYLIYGYGLPLIDEKLGYSIHNDID